MHSRETGASTKRVLYRAFQARQITPELNRTVVVSIKITALSRLRCRLSSEIAERKMTSNFDHLFF